MKQENTDDRQAQTAQQEIERCDSEFIRQAQAFVNYMSKEYAEPADGDIAMLLIALDATGAENTTHLHCTMGNRMRIAADIADRMHDKEWGRDLFRNARIMAGGDEGATDEILRRNRRRLNRDYAFLALPIGYSLLLAVLTAISPAFHLSVTIASVFTMAFLTMLIVSDIKNLRRKIRRLADSIDGDRQERRQMLGAAMMGMLSQMAHRDRNDDDDE